MNLTHTLVIKGHKNKGESLMIRVPAGIEYIDGSVHRKGGQFAPRGEIINQYNKLLEAAAQANNGDEYIRIKTELDQFETDHPKYQEHTLNNIAALEDVLKDYPKLETLVGADYINENAKNNAVRKAQKTLEEALLILKEGKEYELPSDWGVEALNRNREAEKEKLEALLQAGNIEDMEEFIQERTNNPDFVAALEARNIADANHTELKERKKVLKEAFEIIPEFSYEDIRQHELLAAEHDGELSILRDQIAQYKDLHAPLVAEQANLIEERMKADGTWVEYSDETLNDLTQTAYFPSGSREWLEQRKKGIGGSDVGSILRVEGAYNSYQDLLRDKLSPVTDEQVFSQAEDQTAFQGALGRGNAWEKRLFLQVQAQNPDDGITFCKYSWQNNEREYQFANFDGLLTDKNGNPDGILEIKTSSRPEEWGPVEDGLNGIPASYREQVLWYADGAGFNRGKVAVIIDDREMRVYDFKIGDAERASMINTRKKVQNFVDEVKLVKDTQAKLQTLAENNKGLADETRLQELLREAKPTNRIADEPHLQAYAEQIETIKKEGKAHPDDIPSHKGFSQNALKAYPTAAPEDLPKAVKEAQRNVYKEIAMMRGTNDIRSIEKEHASILSKMGERRQDLIASNPGKDGDEEAWEAYHKKAQAITSDGYKQLYINTARQENLPPYVAVDIETNGYNPSSGQIIEYGHIVRADYAPAAGKKGTTKKQEALYKPTDKKMATVGTGMVDVHNITKDMVADKQQFNGSKDADAILKEFKKAGTIQVHNANFEKQWFSTYIPGFADAVKKGEIKIIDTMSLTRRIDVDSKSNKLKDFVENQSIDYANAHRAYADAKMMSDAYESWLDVLRNEKDVY